MWFGDWRMPLAWDVDDAYFDLIGRNGVAQRVADRAKVTQSLAMWSGPTPPEGVEAEIVHVPNAADANSYSAEDVRGKIVFTSSHPHHAKRLLAERGAVGMLSDYIHPSGAKLRDATAWINSFSDDPGGWALLAGDRAAGPCWPGIVKDGRSSSPRTRETASAGGWRQGRICAAARWCAPGCTRGPFPRSRE